jgi:FdrA protein
MYRCPEELTHREGTAIVITRVLVRSDRYYDSVTLMAISGKLSAQPGVREAVVAMGTETNRQLLKQAGLLTPEAEGAGPSDLIVAVGADTAVAAAGAVEQAEQLLREGAVPGGPGAEGGAACPAVARPRTIAEAVRLAPEARLAFISVPGPYAAREARLALEQGLDVMLYSDNVSLEDEVRLKRLAHERGRLLMGPDCGTAILGGVGLGFANAVRPGPIGIVAASGTGAQELSCLIDRLGAGISRIIGTGGRDLSAAVGGLMTLDALARLEADPAITVIAIISKPPAPEVAERVRVAAATGSKPVVLCFLDGSIDEAAVRAVHLANGTPEAALAERLGGGGAGPMVHRLRPGRTCVRGLFSGGTLCSQARRVLEPALGPGDTLVDLGDDAFTAGRPHPMIDPTLRCRRLDEEADDPRTGVILLDVVLGHGAHPDPAGALSRPIRKATDRGIIVIASVTGTEADPQGFSAQVGALEEAGAIVLPTARRAATFAAEVMARG